MKRPKVKRNLVREQWQLALYVPPELVKPLRREATKRSRGYGPTVLAILREYFEAQTSLVVAAEVVVAPEVSDVSIPSPT